MDPNLLPGSLRGQEDQELKQEKRNIRNAGEVLTAPARRGKAAIDDDSYRISSIGKSPTQKVSVKIDVSAQKGRHENLREKKFGTKTVAAPVKNNWHVPADHALGDSWKTILKKPFNKAKAETEFHLAGDEASAKTKSSQKKASAVNPAIIEAKAQPEKTHEDHQREIHHHFSKYLLIIAMPVISIVLIYGLYLLLKVLPPPFNLF